MQTLKEIIQSQWARRKQIFNLAKFDIIKDSRGAALGPAWLFARPIVYVFVFWFALDIGLRAGHPSENGAPYILWLMAGLVPWFYMQEMLGTGVNVFKRFAYLVNKIKFPLSGIPTIYGLSKLMVHVCLVALLLVVYLLLGQPIDLYLLQIPVAIAVMFIFFYMFSLTMSLLSAISKDFRKLLATLTTPIFWLSGIIFDVFSLGIGWIETVLMFNPVTFVVTFFRAALYDKIWIWDKPMALIGFAVVFVLMLLAMVIIYKRTHEEVPDVL